MKKIILLAISAALFITSIVLFIPAYRADSLLSIMYMIFLLVSVIGITLCVMLFFIDKLNLENKLNKKKLEKWRETSIYINYVNDDIVNELPIGIIIYDDESEVKWSNKTANELLLGDYTDGEKVSTIIPEISKQTPQFVFEHKNHYLNIIHNSLQKAIYIFDITSEESIRIKYNLSTMCVGIIHFDNLNNTLSKVDIGLESGIKTMYLGVVFAWAQKYRAFIRPFGDEKVAIVTTREQLTAMLNDKFDVLVKVRDISSANNYRVSISGGFACYEVSPEEVANYANNAVELAEKRGGDQIAINIQGQKIEFIGAKIEKNFDTSVADLRVNSNALSKAITQAEDVFVMPHLESDLDSLGSLILVKKICDSLNKKCYLVLNESRLEKLTATSIEILEENKSDIVSSIISEKKALSNIEEDSLLVVVDTQNKNIVVAPSLLQKTSNLIVIDHHRAENDSITGKFNFIDTNASSVIEIIYGLSEHLEKPITLNNIEANILYAGIIIDTQDLVSKTTVNTLRCLTYFVEQGAQPPLVKQWIRKDFDTITRLNDIISKAERYNDKYLFVTTDEILNSVEISQLSDLGLEIQGVDACFTIAKIDNEMIKISARSFSSINVQLILESLNLGGGGHFTSAALVTKEKSIEELVDMIKKQIDIEYQEGEEQMKVILLEDVKDKGNKNEVIDVKSGYGNFLISNKKAILATKENIDAHNKRLKEQEAIEKQLYNTMLITKKNIEGKIVFVKIQVGQDLKLFGSVTTAKIAQSFEEQHGVLLDKRKIHLSSEINSLGIYQASVTLYKDIKANFQVEVISE